MKRWAIFAALYRIHGVHAQVYRCGNTYPKSPARADAKSMSLRQSAISAVPKPPSSICAAHRGLLLLDSPAVRHARLDTGAQCHRLQACQLENQVAEANNNETKAEELMP